MKKLLLAVSFLILVGCASADRHAREIPVPANWTQQQIATNDNAIQIHWWEQFNDPVLNNLIQTGTHQNLDLKIAATRIRAARAQLLSTRASFLPNVSADASFARARNSALTQLGRFNAGEQELYDVGLDATWEFNLFSISPAIESARATLKAEEENTQGTLLSLLGEIAANYIELRRLQNELVITDHSIKAYQTSLDLTQARLDAGLTSALDSSRAEAALQTQLAARPELISQMTAAIRRLEVLLGQNPGTLDAQLSTPALIPVAASPSLMATPAAVIANRPDIRAAEQTLIASNAAKRVATAQYFPSLSLPSAFGWQSLDSNPLFDSQGQSWSLGAMIRVPVFDFGRIRADVDTTEANAQAAFLTYQKTVQGALSDVETALADYLSAVNRTGSVNRAVETNQKVVDLSELRYKNGLVSYLDVAEAQKSLYAAQQSAIQNQANMASRLVTLYKAMGGGWQGTPVASAQNKAPEPPAFTPPPTLTNVAPSAPVPEQPQANVKTNAPRVSNADGAIVIE